MPEVSQFLASNAALLMALLALVISLRSNFIANQSHELNLKAKIDADRVLLFEKKRELLNEVDRQHARFATLMMLTGQKILLFRDHPALHDSMQGEFDRLKSNLISLQVSAGKNEEQRIGLEAINVGADIAQQEELLASIRRLTIRIEKDISHEQASLNEMRARFGVHSGA